MFRYVILFALFNVAFGLKGRIVNGTATTIDKYPYMANLFSLEEGHNCGGSIINKNTILTAAHCVLDYDIDAVRLGSTEDTKGGKVVQIKSKYAHPNYDPKTLFNDVAVIKLAEDVAESSTIRYIQLATVAPPTGTLAVVLGWGTLCYLTCPSASTLQKVEVHIVSNSDCASSKYNYGTRILDTMICAYDVGKDSCNEDSGGPLVVGNQQVGVVSWGDNCAAEGFPGVYADVASLHSWIVENSG